MGSTCYCTTHFYFENITFTSIIFGETGKQISIVYFNYKNLTQTYEIKKFNIFIDHHYSFISVM